MDVAFLILSIAFLCLGILCLIFGVRNLKIGKGYNKDNISTVYGHISSKNLSKDVYIGTSHTRQYYKHWTDFSYHYCVNGKKYEISDGVPGLPDKLPPTVKIHYQKNEPKYAYIPNITKPDNTALGRGSIFGGVIFICASVFFLYLIL